MKKSNNWIGNIREIRINIGWREERIGERKERNSVMKGLIKMDDRNECIEVIDKEKDEGIKKKIENMI